MLGWFKLMTPGLLACMHEQGQGAIWSMDTFITTFLTNIERISSKCLLVRKPGHPRAPSKVPDCYHTRRSGQAFHHPSHPFPSLKSFPSIPSRPPRIQTLSTNHFHSWNSNSSSSNQGTSSTKSRSPSPPSSKGGGPRAAAAAPNLLA